MRYLVIHENTCIISDIASDMPIFDGMVLGKPICEVIQDIFAKQVKDLYDVDITDAGGNIGSILLIVIEYANKHISIIHNPYMCDVYNYLPDEVNIGYVEYHHIGYVEFVWRIRGECCRNCAYCTCFSECKKCNRCGNYASLGPYVHECITCQRKPPLQAMTKCAKCGCMWMSETSHDICYECACKPELYKAKKCELCKCLWNYGPGSNDQLALYIKYCDKCVLLVGKFCFICSKLETDIVQRILMCDGDELYVKYDGRISDVLLFLGGRKFENPIREYDKSRFDTIMTRQKRVYCHATCANVACNLNIFTKPQDS